MNTIFLLHVGQLGNTGGTPLEDTPAAGMSAPPYLVRVCGGYPVTTGACEISSGSAEGSLTFFRVVRRSANHLFWRCTSDRAGRSRHSAAPLVAASCQHEFHCLLAFGADCRGRLDLRHDASLDQAGTQHSQSPMAAYGRAVMTRSCRAAIPARWSKFLTFQNN